MGWKRSKACGIFRDLFFYRAYGYGLMNTHANRKRSHVYTRLLINSHNADAVRSLNNAYSPCSEFVAFLIDGSLHIAL